MQTIVDLLRQSVDRWGSLPALSMYGEPSSTLTYSELWDYGLRVAAYLSANGVAKADRVVLWGANRPDWVAAFFGIEMLGAIAIPIDVRSREDLLERIVTQTSPKHLVIGEEQRQSLTHHHGTVTSLDNLRSVTNDVGPITVDPASINPDDIAELVFTSGTTGHPKGVILTHQNIISNVKMATTAVNPTPQYRLLSILPLSHMYEQTGGLLTPLAGGASITYLATLRPDVILKAMAEIRATTMACVPQVLELFQRGIEREIRRQGREKMFQRLHGVALRLPFRARRPLFRAIHQRMGGSFDFFLAGGAYLYPELGQWWEGVGIKVLQGYGMTEAAPIVTTPTLTDRDVTSVGRPLPGIELKFAEDHEILVRGPNISPGYWNDPVATSLAFTDDWYHTGDLGYLDPAGRLHLHGRKKNMIVLANGMNIYPEDIEHVLISEPGVKNAVVLGLEHGQDVEVHAVLLLDTDAGAPSDILKRCNQNLTPYQRIRDFTVWPDENFPLTPSLKVKRIEVIERLDTLRAPATPAATE
ncbi:MAG TPA: AMP-binding protein [Nitrolancea sp.]|nr:AMP-binding protein [Nitrolancea sp.]